MADTSEMAKSNNRIEGVRVLVFDLDGTLIDSQLDLALAVNATLKWMGRPPIEHGRISGYIGNGAPKLMQRALGPEANEDEIRRAVEFMLTYYNKHMLDNTIAYPGVEEGLAALARFPMAVLTNKPLRPSRIILESLKLAPYFRAVYGGNSFETKKPDPKGMEILLREFGVTPREVMIIGDSEVDVQTARNSNTWICGVTYGLGSERLSEYPPDIVVDSLIELPALLENSMSSPPAGIR